jgi:hypothetical protein
MIRPLFLLAIVATFGCGGDNTVRFNGTVRDIRMTFESRHTPSHHGNPAAGALVGGVIGGTPGAVIGAAVTDDYQSAAGVGKLIACSFAADTPYGKFRFRHTDLAACSTLRDGDVVPLLVEDGKVCWPTPYCYSESEERWTNVH